MGLCVVRLTPAIDSRRVALLQRRGGYRSAASRAFVAVAQEQAGLSVVRLTPAIDSRRVALLQRRGGYRSAASRAFVAVAKDYTKAIEGRGRRRKHRIG